MLGHTEPLDGYAHPGKPRSWLPLTVSCLCGVGLGVVGNTLWSTKADTRSWLQTNTLAAAAPTTSLAASPAAQFARSIDAYTVSAGAAHKYAVPYVTPVELQLLRGACWLFALGGLLEQSYRAQGVAAGYLKPEQYLRLSEQAAGAVLTAECKNNPICMTGDDDQTYTGNSTQGGEAEWLYYLSKTTSVGTKVALPWSVCPYEAAPGKDDQCSGYEAAHPNSPLEFTIAGLTTYYNLADVKKGLRAAGRPLALALGLWGQQWRLPCTEATAPFFGCDPEGAECKPCPLEANFAGVECCIEQSRFGTNMQGEFHSSGPGTGINAAGGHAMAVVGYSDTYPSSNGDVGALIIKNSWWDGVPPAGIQCLDPTAPCAAGRGSHSVAFLMGQISDVDERELCPNVHNPSNWYKCASLEACTGPKAAMSAKAMRKVHELQCLDRSPYLHGVCDKGSTYFLKNATKFGAGLSVACFLQKGVAGKDFCTPPIWIEDLALLFAPIDKEERPNEPDVCGFYAISYAVYNQVAATLGGTWATDLDIRWTESSYAGAPPSKRLAGKDYTMLEKDTFEQKRGRFAGPFPDLQR